jgi:trehalose 6-phosphate synthase
VDQENSQITCGGKLTVVRPFPISIDYDAHVELAQTAKVENEMARWRLRIGLKDKLLGIGIERLDYTKGIPERLRAIDYFLEHNAEYRERLVFVQIAVPSRAHIPQYQRLDEEVDRITEQINWKWSTDDWRPILLLKEHHNQIEMIALHRLANFCIVSSLHDGMNLVAKEHVASRCDEDGVLILSQFTGTARELTDALLVNPYSMEAMADAIRLALELPESERCKRMQKMRAAVANNNIYRWAGKVFSALVRFDFPEDV